MEVSRQCQLCHALETLADCSNSGDQPIFVRCRECRAKKAEAKRRGRQRKRAVRRVEATEESESDSSRNTPSPCRSPQLLPSPLQLSQSSASRGQPAQLREHANLDESAVSSTAPMLVEELHEMMDMLELESCSLCNERWSDMKLSGGICQRPEG